MNFVNSLRSLTQRAAPSACLVACLMTASAAPVAALELDEVLAKHLQARGGKAAWQAVDSMVLSGQFEAFSQAHPFTLVRLADQRQLYFDHVLGDKKVTIGYDGDTVWWDNPWMKKGAQRVQGVDLTVVERDLDLPNPFFDFEERGHTLTLVGDSEFEGMPAVQIDVARADGLEESWYLDPDTFLEVARVSPGSDFGQAMPQRTFFDDFRDVQGLKIPFRTETQWYTRYRVMEIAEVELNVAVDSTIFTMPSPPGMGPLQNLLGTWTVKYQERQGPQAPWQESEYTSTIATRVAATLIEESFSTEGGDVVRTLSYDSAREVYRMTSISEPSGYLDVQEGTFEGETLVVSNAPTGTFLNVFGTDVTLRTSIKEITKEGFALEIDGNTGDDQWLTFAKATYTPAPAGKP